VTTTPRPSLLGDTDVAVQPLSRTYARGLYIEPHEHVWGQLLYAMSGLLRELILRLVEQGDDQQQDDYEALVSLALLDLKRARCTSRRILAKV
jgi:predicted membrane chloride channel (bestrophin family)